MSPSYPQNYIRDIACSYTITQYPGKITSLTFIDFEVGSKVDNECINDYVEVMYMYIHTISFRIVNIELHNHVHCNVSSLNFSLV